MATGNVQVLGSWASPFTTRVRTALAIKSVEYEFFEENFYSDKSERLLKANPIHKQIPVLIHDKKPICESLVIVEYIDEAWADGPSLLPSDPYERAVARFWGTYIDLTWFAAIKELINASGDEARAAAYEKIWAGWLLLEAAFVKCGKGEAFFGGKSIGYLDIVLGCYLTWVKVVELMAGLKLLDEAKAPGLVGWAERFRSHSAAKEFLPEAQKVIDFYMEVQAERAAAAATATAASG